MKPSPPRSSSTRGEATLEGTRVPLARIRPRDTEDATRWRDDLVRAVVDRDDLALERAWTLVRSRALWRHLGFESIESFCIAELGMTAGELVGLLPTEDLQPERSVLGEKG